MQRPWMTFRSFVNLLYNLRPFLQKLESSDDALKYKHTLKRFLLLFANTETSKKKNNTKYIYRN